MRKYTEPSNRTFYEEILQKWLTQLRTCYKADKGCLREGLTLERAEWQSGATWTTQVLSAIV